LQTTIGRLRRPVAAKWQDVRPFLDGNKRTALNAAIVFLGLNGFDVVDDEGILYAAMIGFSTGEWSKSAMAVLLERLSEPWKDDD
jgi:prophage maintenance system killer protein